MRWRRSPQRTAWSILIISFFLCSLCSVAVPLGARNYVLHATESRATYVTAMAGTVQLRTSDKDQPTAVTTQPLPVPEGSSIMTGATDRALLVVPAPGDNSQVALTTQLFQNTEVLLTRASRPRFKWGVEPVRIILGLQAGRIAIASARTSDRPIAVEVDTPSAQLTLSPGTYIVELDERDVTTVTIRSGAAQVLAQSALVTANSEQRVSIKPGEPPELPVPSALNLVANGTFDDGLAAWQVVKDIEAGRGEPGEATVEANGDQKVVHFLRQREDDVPNMVGIRQEIDRDVQGYESLVVSLDLQLLQQSVPGGGYESSEYPVMIDLFYTDIYGKDLHWYQSFYYFDLPPSSNWKQPTGEKIPVGALYTYESGNLFDELQSTRPAHINYIQIYASGHDYESRISSAAVTVR